MNPIDDPMAAPSPKLRLRKSRLLFLGLAAVALGAGYGFYRMVARAREAAAMMRCNLGQIALALHSYQDAHGRLPPAFTTAPDGRPLHSWRVLILPYLEEQKLYAESRLDEPWDSPHNLSLVPRMPISYQINWQEVVPIPPHHTTYRVITGPGTLFEDVPGGLRLPDDCPDGADRTLLFVEAGRPIPWTKPDEFVLAEGEDLRLDGAFRKYTRAIAADSFGYRFLPRTAHPELLRALATRNGGEAIPEGWGRRD